MTTEMNQTTAQYWIDKLELIEHPEGGYFKETYRSEEEISTDALPERFAGKRNFGTSIYFLLTTESVSNFHRLKSDEIWHFHQGGAAKIHFISEEGAYSFKTIGADFENGETLQVIISKNTWFAAEVIKDDFILIGCTVAPGFEFEDFELADQADLSTKFPTRSALIRKFTRS